MGAVRRRSTTGRATAGNSRPACATRTTKKDFSAERPAADLPVRRRSRPIKANTDADFVTWDLSATYTVNQNVNLYGRVATGFRAPSIQGRILFAPTSAGGTNPATNCVSVADDEKLLSDEVGVKTELLDRRLRLNWRRLHATRSTASRSTAVGGQYNIATLLNADKTERLRVRGRHRLRAGSCVAGDARRQLQPHRDRRPNLAVAPCGGGCTVLDPIGPNGALRRRQPAAARAGVDLQRHRRLTASPIGAGEWSAPASTGPTTARRTSSSTSRRSSTATPSSSACASATPVADGTLRARPVRPQPHRRGHRSERHRLRQPHRHDQRSAADRPRVRGQVLSTAAVPQSSTGRGPGVAMPPAASLPAPKPLELAARLHRLRT